MKRHYSGEKGFTLVMTVVIATFLVVVATSLAQGRTIWRFMASKQLDSATLEHVSNTDAAGWLSALRNEYQRANSTYQATAVSGISAGRVEFALSNDAVFVPSSDGYPVIGGTTSATTLASAPTLFSGGMVPLISKISDPYQGIYQHEEGDVYLSFVQQMTGERRASNYEEGDSNLRAWDSLDGQLVAKISARAVPISAFTLFCPEPYDGSSLDLSNTFLHSVDSRYTCGVSYSAVGGVGRIYVEGKVKFTSSLSIGIPLVATKGLDFSVANSPLLVTPVNKDYVIEYSVPTNLPAFLKERYVTLKGMVATSDETPSRLIRPGMTEISGKWRMAEGALADPLNGFGNTLFSQAAKVSIVLTGGTAFTVGVDTTNTDYFNGGDTADVAKLADVANWALDTAKQEIVYKPAAGFYDTFTTPPVVMQVYVYDADGTTQLPDYKWRLQIPSVAALGGNKKLTVYSPRHPVVLEDGFNTTGTDNGVMVVAPRIYVLPKVGSTPNLYAVNGIMVTNAYNPHFPFFGENPSDSVALTGGLVLWSRLVANPGGTVACVLTPDVAYLDGNAKLPFLVPAVTDVRYASKSFTLFEIKKVAGSGTEVETTTIKYDRDTGGVRNDDPIYTPGTTNPNTTNPDSTTPTNSDSPVSISTEQN